MVRYNSSGREKSGIIRFSGAGVMNMEKTQYRYKIRLESTADVIAFTKAAVGCLREVWLVNGHHRLSAKSYLGVALARLAWEEIYVESDYDCYFDFEKFIA